jgi:hypothetical protein
MWVGLKSFMISWTTGLYGSSGWFSYLILYNWSVLLHRSFPIRFLSSFLKTGHVWSWATGRTQHSLLLSLTAHRHIIYRQQRLNPGVVHPITSSHQRLVEDRSRAIAAPLIGRAGPASGQHQWPLWLHQLHHPYSNVQTTKCITLCTCVNIFSQTFSRVLALTRI